jgi:iron-sulfur cluster assembly protein
MTTSTWETLEAGMLGHGYSEEEIDKLLNTLNTILKEVSDPETISLTERAALKFNTIASQEGKAGTALRFQVIPAGCSGFEYELDFSEGFQASDEKFTSNGIDIHVSKNQVEQLKGSEIDFVDGLNPGFKISNPNVRNSCGCGNSHGY